MSETLSFSRHELAGAFGDLGTDLPLLVGVVLATGMDAPAAFVAAAGPGGGARDG